MVVEVTRENKMKHWDLLKIAALYGCIGVFGKQNEKTARGKLVSVYLDLRIESPFQIGDVSCHAIMVESDPKGPPVIRRLMSAGEFFQTGEREYNGRFMCGDYMCDDSNGSRMEVSGDTFRFLGKTEEEIGDLSVFPDWSIKEEVIEI